MKKLVSLAIILVMILSVIPVNAAIDMDKVKVLPLNKVSKNSGSITVTPIGDTDGVSNVYRVYGGGASARVTGKFSIELNDIPSDVAAGDYIYINFYYRINSKYTDGTTDTVAPSPFYQYPKFGGTSGTGNFGYSQADVEFDKWYMGSIKTTFETATATGQRFVMVFQAGEYVSVDIGGITAMYLGPVTYTSDDEFNVDGQINQFISVASFSSIMVDGEEVDLATYPESFNKTVAWTGSLPEIIAVDGRGNTVAIDPEKDVVYEGNLPKTVYLTAYPLDCNMFDPDSSNKKVYAINLDYHRTLTDVVADGSSITLNLDIFNLNSEKLDYTAVICAYDKVTGKCVASVPYKVSLAETDDSKHFSFTYTGDKNYADYDCKAYVISPLRMFKIN